MSPLQVVNRISFVKWLPTKYSEQPRKSLVLQDMMLRYTAQYRKNTPLLHQQH